MFPHGCFVTTSEAIVNIPAPSSLWSGIDNLTVHRLGMKGLSSHRGERTHQYSGNRASWGRWRLPCYLSRSALFLAENTMCRFTSRTKDSVKFSQVQWQARKTHSPSLLPSGPRTGDAGAVEVGVAFRVEQDTLAHSDHFIPHGHPRAYRIPAQYHTASSPLPVTCGAATWTTVEMLTPGCSPGSQAHARPGCSCWGGGQSVFSPCENLSTSPRPSL